MIDFLLIALLQAAAGDPAAPPADAPQAEAQAESPAPAAAQQQSMDPADQVRCRRVASTGSRIAATRVCMSAREEERLREETAHAIREQRSRAIGGTAQQ